jgi:hypothetical protein
VWATDGHYADPTGEADGRAGLSAFIGNFYQQMPDAHFSHDGPIAQHHTFARFAWTLHLANGTAVEGMDFAELTDDGQQIKRIVGFF